MPLVLAVSLLCGAGTVRAQDVAPIIVDGHAALAGGASINEIESESSLIGPAAQPEWTSRRVFAETDTYVIPAGDFELNQYYISSHARGSVPMNSFASEFEYGLPWRTQIDIEMYSSIHHGGKYLYDGTLVELPHALANWGKIPLNPTVNAGWRFNTREFDAYFFRLLLAAEFSRKIHFGADFTFERQIGGPRRTDFEFNQALSWIAIEHKLAIGYEARLEYEHEHGGSESGGGVRSPGPVAQGTSYTTSALAGPSVLYNPTRRTHLDLVALGGLNLGRNSAQLEVYLIFGIDLGSRGAAEKDEGRAEAEHFRPLHVRH